MAKTTCPVTRTEFTQHAQPVKVDIDGNTLTAEKKEFGTGSFGWFLSGKAVLMVDGKPVTVQVTANLAVVGSKEAK